jgi:hypothetical protein
VNWSLTVIVRMFTIIRVIKVIITLVVVMLAVPTRNWSLMIFIVVVKMFTLTRLPYLQSFYELHPPIKVDMFFIFVCISCNCSWISLRALLEFKSMVLMTSRLCIRRPLCKCMQKLILRLWLRSQTTLASKTQYKITANI